MPEPESILQSAAALFRYVFSEIRYTLAQIYKQKDGNTYKGGPAYYIEKALHARWLGILFAISLIATFAFGSNGNPDHHLPLRNK